MRVRERPVSHDQRILMQGDAKPPHRSHPIMANECGCCHAANPYVLGYPHPKRCASCGCALHYPKPDAPRGMATNLVVWQ